MKNDVKLVHKVKRLIRRAGLPRWLHQYGPKTYELWNHALAWLIKQECKLGYRRVTRLLRGLGLKCPCPSALCMGFARMPLPLWQRLLAATIGSRPDIVAIDGTGISRPLPSPYYYRRIDKPYPIEIPLKLSIAVDTRTKKILALRLRAKPRHDIKDVKYLIARLPWKPRCIVADKGYDAEWLHQYCKKQGIKVCIPLRKWGKVKHHMLSLRRQAAKNHSQKTYGRREIVESTFGAIKRKFGASISSINMTGKRAEAYSRAITHNLIRILNRLFERCRSHSKHLYTASLNI